MANNQKHKVLTDDELFSWHEWSSSVVALLAGCAGITVSLVVGLSLPSADTAAALIKTWLFVGAWSLASIIVVALLGMLVTGMIIAGCDAYRRYLNQKDMNPKPGFIAWLIDDMHLTPIDLAKSIGFGLLGAVGVAAAVCLVLTAVFGGSSFAIAPVVMGLTIGFGSLISGMFVCVVKSGEYQKNHAIELQSMGSISTTGDDELAPVTSVDKPVAEKAVVLGGQQREHDGDSGLSEAFEATV